MRICPSILLTLIAIPAIPVTTLGVTPQTTSQRACIAKLNAAGERVAGAVARNLVDCVRLALAGRLAPGESAADCLAADKRGWVENARARTVDVEGRYCTVPPDFGPTSAAAVNAAFDSPLGVSAVFGPDLDAALAAGAGNAATARCQRMVAKRVRNIIRGRLRNFRICQRSGLRDGSIAEGFRLADCYGKARPGWARRAARSAARIATECAGIEFTTAFPGGCAGESIGGLVDCIDRLVDCDTTLAVEAADSISTMRPHVFVDGVATNYCGDRPVTDKSVARQWNEEVLNAIRIDFPRPPIHARNLLHLSIAMWDAWAAYDPAADGYLFTEKHVSPDPQADRKVAISFAAYRVLARRYALSPNASVSENAFRTRMNALGFDPDFTEAVGNTPSAIGNRIGAAVLSHGQSDGANESLDYEDPSYSPVNEPLIVKFPGTTMSDPNRWQPLALDLQIGQNGLPIPGNVQEFVGPQWGTVLPFAIDFLSLLPGPPPLLGDVTTDADFKAQAVEVIQFSSLLTPDDPTLIDISPATLGNNSLGANDGTGYGMNPATGLPYAPEMVKRADFGRVLAEFWADGPNSETPPGHWNTIANYVVDHPLFERRFK